MRKFYGPPIPGSISPVPATEEMTEPVGIKDGQLWTKGPDGGLEERVETLETDVGNLQETATEHGTAINNLEIDMTDAENDISGLQNRMTAAESNIGSNAQAIGQLEFDVSQAQTDIVGLGLSKLDKPTNEGETGDVIVKTANGTEYQAVAPFNPNGTYPNVTAGKAISAKSLENVSEDSGATQTAPFFFQATATANNTAETPTAPVFKLKSVRGNTIVYNQLVDGVSATYPTISGHVYWFKHDPLVSLVTSTGTDINVPSPQSDKLVDLTRWFNGSIPQAILDNPSVFPINYYDGELTYSAGELKNCSCMELKTVEFNALDINKFAELYPDRCHVSGNDLVIDNPSSAMFSNGIPFKSVYNQQYYLSGKVVLGSAVNGRPYIRYADGTYTDVIVTDGAFGVLLYNKPISSICLNWSASGSFTIKDFCINLAWDNARNGEYAPYSSHTYPMVWSGKSAGSAYDEKLPDGTEITRIGSIDLGTLDYTYVAETKVFYSLISPQAKYPANDNMVGNAVCGTYDYCPYNQMYYDFTTNMVISFRVADFTFRIRNLSYTDPVALKSALSGVILYYELATPTTSEGTAFTSEIEGDDYGTMSFDSVVPVGNEFFYPADYSLLIDDLGNYTGYDVTKLMLKTDNVVPSAPTSDGTYVLKCVVSGGIPSYSWIAET